MLLAKIWTFWIAPALTVGVVLAILSLGVAYLRTVVRPKYPPRGSRPS